MTLFGKDPEYLEVVTAEFLPDGSKLYILVADSDCNLHVLQYDPEGTYYPSLPIFIPLGSSGRSKKKKKNSTNPPYHYQTPNPPTAIACYTAANSTQATSLLK